MLSLIVHICHFNCDQLFISCVFIVVIEIAFYVFVEFHSCCQQIREKHQEEEADAHANCQDCKNIDVGEVAIAGSCHQGVQFSCEERTLGTIDESGEGSEVALEKLSCLVVHEVSNVGVVVEVASFIGC